MLQKIYQNVYKFFDSNCPSYFNEKKRSEFENFLKEDKFPYWLVTEGNKIVGYDENILPMLILSE